MNYIYIFTCMLIMAGMTYLIRMLPMVLFRKKIKSRFIQSFLYYVPYAVLSAMTFPAIFSSTGTTMSAVLGTAAALILAYWNKGLLTVAVAASAVVFLAQMAGL